MDTVSMADSATALLKADGIKLNYIDENTFRNPVTGANDAPHLERRGPRLADLDLRIEGEQGLGRLHGANDRAGVRSQGVADLLVEDAIQQPGLFGGIDRGGHSKSGHDLVTHRLMMSVNFADPTDDDQVPPVIDGQHALPQAARSRAGLNE